MEETDNNYIAPYDRPPKKVIKKKSVEIIKETREEFDNKYPFLFLIEYTLWIHSKEKEYITNEINKVLKSKYKNISDIIKKKDVDKFLVEFLKFDNKNNMTFDFKRGHIVVIDKLEHTAKLYYRKQFRFPDYLSIYLLFKNLKIK